MQFEIKSRWTGAGIFTAEIEADENTSANIKLGLAVRVAVNARADLDGADLRCADLRCADLRDADLGGANLNGTCGLNGWIKNIQIEDWPISYTSEVMQIGCQRHTFDAWRNFSDAEIRAMDGRRALNFWHKWREVIFRIIEMAPAHPTKAADPVETEAAE